jgi:hypothetical protein
MENVNCWGNARITLRLILLESHCEPEGDLNRSKHVGLCINERSCAWVDFILIP